MGGGRGLRCIDEPRPARKGKAGEKSEGGGGRTDEDERGAPQSAFHGRLGEGAGGGAHLHGTPAHALDHVPQRSGPCGARPCAPLACVRDGSKEAEEASTLVPGAFSPGPVLGASGRTGCSMPEMV